VTVSTANHNPWLRFGVTSSRNATFANPMFIPVVFANPAKFAAEAFVKPANEDSVVATAGFANPVRATGAVGTPVCVTAGECGVRDRSDCKAEVFPSAVSVSAALASPLFLPVVFTSPAKFEKEACVKPVTCTVPAFLKCG